MKIANCEDIYNTLVGLAGYFTAVGAGVSNPVSASFGQKLNGLIPAFQLNAWRYVAEVFMSGCLAVFTQTDVRIPYIKVPWMIIITVLSTILNTSFYTAAIFLPIGFLELANSSITYIGSLLLSKRFLYTQTVCFQYFAFIVILLGQFLLWQPCFLFPSTRCHSDSSILTNATNNSINPELEYITLSSSSSSFIGYVLVVIASLASCLRSFACRCLIPDIPTSAVSLWTGGLGLILSLIVMIYLETPIIFLEKFDIWLLLGHAGFAGSACIFANHSQQNLHPMAYTILLNSKVVFGFVLQFAFPQIFMQGVHNIWEVVGIVLCASGVVSYVVIGYRLEKVSSD